VGRAETVTKLFELRDLRDCASVRFPLPPVRGCFGPLALEGFAYRASDGTLRAWVNLCPHRAQSLDLGDGRLFNSLGEIECHAHGARFDPETGACTAGPCPGASLQPVSIREEAGAIWLE
jgi:nitrite reductase/ring-hydroxylating ferredoxin subunit